MSFKKYQIEITETLRRIVELEARSLDEAMSEIHRQYNDEEIVLDDADFMDAQINAFNPSAE
jgi:beta-galactosidase beta subunit